MKLKKYNSITSFIHRSLQSGTNHVTDKLLNTFFLSIMARLELCRILMQSRSLNPITLGGVTFITLVDVIAGGGYRIPPLHRTGHSSDLCRSCYAAGDDIPTSTSEVPSYLDYSRFILLVFGATFLKCFLVYDVA